MRKNLIIPVLLLVAASTALANDATDHTFYSIRPQFQSGMPERVTMFRDAPLAAENGWGGAMQFVPFGGRSTNAKKLARYFMYGGKDALFVQSTVGGDLSDNNLARDINPLNFGVNYFISPEVLGNYTSTLIFRPQETVYGFGFDYKQYIGHCGCEKQWWFEISFPIVHVRNDMRITESGLTTTGLPGAAPFNAVSVTQSFSNINRLQFGRIDGAKHRTGVADIEIKLGYDYANEECYHADGYIGVVIPTGNKPRGIYVFEPMVGNNHHVGVMFGGSFGLQIWECGDRSINLEFETNSRYLFRNTQVRSFDLRYRPWSRYCLAYANATNAAEGIAFATQLINLLTQKVNVKPRFTRDFNAALVYESCGFQGELGYNFWARQGEKVTLKRPFVPGPAVLDLSTDGVDINRLSNIGNDNAGAGTAYTTATAIRAEDLDLDSAAHPATISHIIYGSMGYRWEDMCWPLFVGLGGSYEFDSLNTSLERWNIWGKIGVSF